MGYHHTHNSHAQSQLLYLNVLVNCMGVRLRMRVMGKRGRKAMDMRTAQLTRGEQAGT